MYSLYFRMGKWFTITALWKHNYIKGGYELPGQNSGDISWWIVPGTLDHECGY